MTRGLLRIRCHREPHEADPSVPPILSASPSAVSAETFPDLKEIQQQGRKPRSRANRFLCLLASAQNLAPACSSDGLKLLQPSLKVIRCHAPTSINALPDQWPVPDTGGRCGYQQRTIVQPCKQRLDSF